MNTPITESVRRTLDEMQLSSLEAAYQCCMDRGIDPKALVMDTQPIAFESAADAYTLGTALAIFRGAKTAEEAANIIGEGLQACTKTRQRGRATPSGYRSRCIGGSSIE